MDGALVLVERWMASQQDPNNPNTMRTLLSPLFYSDFAYVVSYIVVTSLPGGWSFYTLVLGYARHHCARPPSKEGCKGPGSHYSLDEYSDDSYLLFGLLMRKVIPRLLLLSRVV